MYQWQECSGANQQSSDNTWRGNGIWSMGRWSCTRIWKCDGDTDGFISRNPPVRNYRERRIHCTVGLKFDDGSLDIVHSRSGCFFHVPSVSESSMLEYHNLNGRVTCQKYSGCSNRGRDGFNADFLAKRHVPADSALLEVFTSDQSITDNSLIGTFVTIAQHRLLFELFN